MGLFSKKEKAVKVLSIDDSRLVQDLLAFEMTDIGFEFLTASNGEDGVKLAEKEQPDIILLDVQMPGISGLDTCLLLKKNKTTSHIPVIMCTSESLMRTVETAMANGAVGYVNKPFNIELVKQKISKTLNITIPSKTPPPPQAQPGPAAVPLPPAPAAPQSPSVPPVLPHLCVSCGKYLVYVPQYKAYYCYVCNKYPDPQPAPPAVSRRCSGCGAELAFLHDQNCWYCFACKK